MWNKKDWESELTAVSTFPGRMETDTTSGSSSDRVLRQDF